MNQVQADKFLNNTWKLQGVIPNVLEHVHLGHIHLENVGRYRINAQILAMANHKSGPALGYFTIIGALFIGGVDTGVITGGTKVERSEIHLAISNGPNWNVETVNPEWIVDVEEPDILDFRVGHFASAGAAYNPAVDWLGIAGANNQHPENGRTWLRVELL